MWCSGRTRGKSRKKVGESSDSEEDHPKSKKKRKTITEERIDRVDDIVDELREKHSNTYTTLQYQVWAETILGERHQSLDMPPKGSFFQKKNCTMSPEKSNRQSTVITLIRAADLKSTYIKQIKELQSLLAIGAITDEDFERQKKKKKF